MHKIAQSFNNKIVALKLGATTYRMNGSPNRIIMKSFHEKVDNDEDGKTITASNKPL